MIDILDKYQFDPLIGPSALKALEMIRSSKLKFSHGPSGGGQYSKDIAKLYDFRKKSAYFKDGAVFGLDETIEGLANSDAIVHLCVLETDGGYVALWLENKNILLGVIVFKIDAGN